MKGEAQFESALSIEEQTRQKHLEGATGKTRGSSQPCMVHRRPSVLVPVWNTATILGIILRWMPAMLADETRPNFRFTLCIIVGVPLALMVSACILIVLQNHGVAPVTNRELPEKIGV